MEHSCRNGRFRSIATWIILASHGAALLQKNLLAKFPCWQCTGLSWYAQVTFKGQSLEAGSRAEVKTPTKGLPRSIVNLSCRVCGAIDPKRSTWAELTTRHEELVPKHLWLLNMFLGME
eukprot:5327186-Amphidinium_carterae.2